MRELLNSMWSGLQRPLFTVAGSEINGATLVTFVLIILLSVVVSRVSQRVVSLFLKHRGVSHEGTLGVATRLTHYFIMAVGVSIGIETLGINLTALFAAGAVFAIALGFAMQNIAQNFMSGLILLSERTIKPGDVIQFDDQMVRVVNMGTRATLARTLNDEDLIIPNANLVQAMVKNYTLKDSLYRIRTVVGVAYSSDLKQVQATLRAAAKGIEGRIQDRDPTVFLIEFGNSSVNFEVSIWVDTPWQARVGRSDLNTAIWWALKDAGITIAFPQMDVHLDPPLTRALTRSQT